MAKRISVLFVSLFMLIGMLFNGGVVKATEGDGYTISFYQGTWDNAQLIRTKKTDASGRLSLTETDDSDLLTYQMNDGAAEGWAYNPENSRDVAYSMQELKDGITLSGDINMYPVRRHTVTFKKDGTNWDADKTVTTNLDGTIPEASLPSNPTQTGKTFSAWYYLSGETKYYVYSLKDFLFSWDATLYADWYGTTSVSVDKTSDSFGELVEGYDSPSRKEFVITNNGEDSVTLKVESNPSGFFLDNNDSFSLAKNESKTIKVGINSGLKSGENDSKIYTGNFPIINTATGAPLASFSVNATIKKNATYHACIITPNTNARTDSFTVTCPNTDIIQNISNDSLIMFRFEEPSQGGPSINPTPIRDGGTLTVNSDMIRDEGLYLNGDYRVYMTVDSEDHTVRTKYELNNGEMVSMNTSHLVKRAVLDSVVQGKNDGKDGILITASSQEGKDYLKAVYDNRIVPGPRPNDYTEFVLETKDDAGNYKSIWMAYGEAMSSIFIKIDDGNLFIPDSVLKYFHVANGTYGFTIKVPGYLDYYVSDEHHDPSTPDKRLVITCGGENPGTFYMKQNEDYSITIKAGKKPNSEESNFDILTTAIRGFDWTYEGSSRSWTISTEKLISISDIDPNNETVTIKYDPTDEGGLIGLYSYIYNYEHDIPTMTFIAENYAPGIIYSIDVPTSRNIHFKNPIRDVPTDLVAYILGTKVMITTSDRLYLAGLNSIEFQQDRNGKVRGDWVMRKKDWDFSDLKYNTQSQKYELSIPVTFNDLDKFTPFPLVEFMLLTRNAAYRDVQGGPKENFKASAFLENTQNALDNNLDPEKLADLDDDTKTDFKHVDIEGTVTSNDNVVDINGSIAGAVTEEDTDLHDNEKINISTTITEGIEAADEQDIMNYLNGHHLGEVKHAVGITVVKTYEGQEPQVVKEIGVNSAIVFDNMPALEPGREYIIVTKHNGKIKTIPVTYKNGKVIGYTNEFSSFVLTTQDVPTPSKKESSNNSSSSTKKTDNVVTCQMAGYPANYAWNEAAKACQPGYLDANGVFRSTAKAGVPNTYDKGLMGNVISLVTASVIAMIAAHLLKNG